MTAKTQLSITEAAQVAGVSRRTFQRHMKEKSITFTIDARGKKLIDISELVRVYGELKEPVTPDNTRQNKTTTYDVTPDVMTIYEQKIKALEQQIEMLQQDRAERKEREIQLHKEKEHLQQEKEKLLSMLERSQMLLEDKREKESISEASETSKDDSKPQKSQLAFWTLLISGIAATMIITALITAWILGNDNPLGFFLSTITQYLT